MHRQSELPFVDLLSNVRVGQLTPEQLTVLKACSGTVPDAEDAIHLYPNREPVAVHNRTMVQRLPGQLFSLRAHDSGVDKDRLNEDVQAPEWLELKLGARVMCLKNLDVAGGLVQSIAPNAYRH